MTTDQLIMEAIKKDYPNGWRGTQAEMMALHTYYKRKLSQRSLLQKFLDWLRSDDI